MQTLNAYRWPMHGLALIQPSQRPAGRREPLYNLDEIADRLGIAANKLRMDLGVHRTAGAPEPARKGTGSNKSLYRLGDFKRYLKTKEDPAMATSVFTKIDGKLARWEAPDNDHEAAIEAVRAEGHKGTILALIEGGAAQAAVPAEEEAA